MERDLGPRHTAASTRPGDERVKPRHILLLGQTVLREGPEPAEVVRLGVQQHLQRRRRRHRRAPLQQPEGMKQVEAGLQPLERALANERARHLRCGRAPGLLADVVDRHPSLACELPFGQQRHLAPRERRAVAHMCVNAGLGHLRHCNLQPGLLLNRPEAFPHAHRDGRTSPGRLPSNCSIRGRQGASVGPSMGVGPIDRSPGGEQS